MKNMPYIKRLTVIGLLLCQMGCPTAFSAPATEPQLKKFHNVSVLPHTGQMQYDVELYRIQDADFDFPISITYSCDGFRPFDYSDPVGSGWTLNAGGVITRQIMGDADDMKPASIYPIVGFYALLKSDIPTPSSAMEMLEGITYTRYCSYDCQSDIYTFSFAGYSGSFIIDWDGKAVLLSGDFVDIDLSKMTIQDKSTYVEGTDFARKIPLSSTIIITTDDGWKYTFGGTTEALEYANTQDNDVDSDPIVMAWHLTSVEAPNGRKVSFHYKPTTDSEEVNQYHLDTDHTAYYLPNSDFYSRTKAPFTSNALDYYHLTQLEDWEYMFMDPYRNWTRTPRLDSITTSERLLKVSFRYTTLSHALYSSEKYGNQQKSFLTSLQVTADKKDVGNWDFTYEKTGNETISHWYLTQLQCSETVHYDFLYDWSETTDIAKASSIDSIDLYGYSILHPTYGLLQQSEEPMGSVTTYSYTPCKYDSLRIFKKKGDKIVSVLKRNTERRMLHAQSISSITVTNAKEELLLQKSYKYDDAPAMMEGGKRQTNTTSDETTSPPFISGPVYNMYGVLNIDYALLNDTADSNYSEKSYTLYPVLRLHKPYFTPIEYGKVVEKVKYGNERNSSVTHIYHYGSTDDMYEYKGRLDFNHFTDVLPYLLQWERRSKLLHKQEYIGNTNQLKHESYYEYNYYPLSQPVSDSVIYLPRPSFRYTAMQSGECKIIIPIVPPALLSTSKYDIEANGRLQQHVSYQRDARHRIVRKDIDDGNRHKFVRYVYADNLPLRQDTLSDEQVAGYAGIVLQHRIGSPVETISGFVRNGKDYITNGEITLYKRYGGATVIPPYNPPSLSDSMASAPNKAPRIIFPTWYAPLATLSLQTAEPLTDYSPLSVQGNRLCADSRYDTTAVYSYNRDLRMTEVIPQNGIAVQYKWDELGLYCIAETAGGQQHSYTYYPYIGIATETDQRGVTTYYAYDSLGRLTEVWRMADGKKQIINAWKYHYATEE